jgi:hypothetical protein
MEDSGLPVFIAVIAAAVLVIGIVVATAAVNWAFILALLAK